MYTPSERDYRSLPGYSRTYKQSKLTLGVFFPIEAFPGDEPQMVNQIALAEAAEAANFAAVWVRDVPLRDPTFGDVGQVFDPWVYLGFLAGQTTKIAFGTAAIVLPIRHPLHVAKAAASVDQLSGGRLLLGVASGDRPVEFPAFGIHPDHRGERFRTSVAVFRESLRGHFDTLEWPGGLVEKADLIPKPIARDIPLLVTGSSRQSLDWIATHADGWLSYPRPFLAQKSVLDQWRSTVEAVASGEFKPFSQSLFVDLAFDPDEPPRPIHQGYRLGHKHLIDLLFSLEKIGVNHVMFNLKYGQRPAAEVLEEIAEHVAPYFPAHSA